MMGSGKSTIGGLLAKKLNSVLIDIDKKDAYDMEKYWDPVFATEGQRIILDPGEFYILSSSESIAIPPSHAAEMVPFKPSVGEFRVHYAGFFDPGFGLVEGKVSNTRAVLEVRSHDVPFLIEQGQTVCRLIYERMSSLPKKVYGGKGSKSNYQSQGLKLSKHFE